MTETGFIYVLVDPRDGEIRYVGQTVQTLKKRLAVHCSERSNTHRAHWIALLARLCYRPIIRRIQTVPLGMLSGAERYWILFLRTTGCRLTNLTEGGEGVRGLKHSAATKLKLSFVHKGRPLTAQHKARLSLSHMGCVVSDETKTKIGLQNKGRVKSPENIETLRQAQRGNKASAATKQKMSDTRRGRKFSAAHRAAMCVAQAALVVKKRAASPSGKLRPWGASGPKGTSSATREKMRVAAIARVQRERAETPDGQLKRPGLFKLGRNR